jgi:heme/copper-type cytochrome/quinol oxidase subunit 2
MKLNNDEEKDLRKNSNAQKLALYWLLGLIYSAFIGVQLGRIQAITNFNYTLHEMLLIPATLALYIGPVVFIIYLYYLIKYLRKGGRQKGNFISKVKAIIVIVSIIIIASITAHQSHEVHTGGIFELEEKLYEEGKYYLVFDDKKLKVSMNEYQLVEVNEEYLVSFIWNSRTPNKGRLETIEPIKYKKY